MSGLCGMAIKPVNRWFDRGYRYKKIMIEYRKGRCPMECIHFFTLIVIYNRINEMIKLGVT